MKNIPLFAAAGVVFYSTLAGQGKQAPRPFPEGDVKQLVEAECTTCHPATMITGAGHTPEDWKLLVERMVSAGAEIPKDKIAAATAYLAKNFPEGNVPK